MADGRNIGIQDAEQNIMVQQKDPMRDSLMSSSCEEEENITFPPVRELRSMTSEVSNLSNIDLEYDMWQGQFEFAETYYGDVFHPMQYTCDVSDDDDETKVQMLTQQMGIFADNQVSIDDRYSRVQQENAVLRERITMLEEQQREKQMRADDRLAEEQKRNKELISRIEREKQLTVENHVIKNRSFEKEKISLEGETQKLKAANERLIKEKSELEDRISDLEYATKQLQQENSKVSEMAKREKEELRIERERSYQVIEELRSEVERLRAIEEAFRKRSPSNEYMSLNPDLEIEVKILREKNHNLNEQMEDLQAQLLTCQLEEGRTLITANNNSLAAEFELMTIDEGAQIATENDKLKNSLRDSQEANLDLRSYIDAILLNVVENYPQLLEVKRK